jgi:hypothetical protein
MASGHVNRPNGPNTWLHRLTLQREESPCQLGAVHTWHITSFSCTAKFGRYPVHSGLWQAVRPADLWVHGLAEQELPGARYPLEPPITGATHVIACRSHYLCALARWTANLQGARRPFLAWD